MRPRAGVLAWDVGVVAFLVLAAGYLWQGSDDRRMAENAARQQEGEWTTFWVTLGGVAFSFAAVISEFRGVKDMAPGARGLHVGLVAATLLLSWLVTHVMFGLRYAHEYYTRGEGRAAVDGGLEFPEGGEGAATPDYSDFLYFALVLGMTFQVSDVQITSRKLRRLATVHGVIGFLFNTVIVALTVNIGAGMLG